MEEADGRKPTSTRAARARTSSYAMKRSVFSHLGPARSASYTSFSSRSPLATSWHGWSHAWMGGRIQERAGRVPLAARA